ncbi:MAG TPA: MaoC family dehydratase [Acetobacteraceae bacterium]|nr:MaoC family dehydratase [Acetobacteraceae bacterium]
MTGNDPKNLLYLEDLHVGQRFVSDAERLTETQITRFAAEWDPQPFHLDAEAARATFFEGLAASGWHTAAISMRLLVRGGLPIAGGIIGSGGELLWMKPVRPNDTLHVETEVLEIVPSRSKPDRGMVQVRCLTLNQDRETVQSFSPKLVVPRRSNSVPAAG